MFRVVVTFPSYSNRFIATILCPTIMSTKINKYITTYPSAHVAFIEQRGF